MSNVFKEAGCQKMALIAPTAQFATMTVKSARWPYLTFFLPLSTSILRIEYKASMTWKCLLALPHDGLLASEFFSPVPAMAYDR